MTVALVCCPTCNGSGALPSGWCSGCGGSGEVTAEKAARLLTPTTSTPQPCDNECGPDGGGLLAGVLSGDPKNGVIDYVVRCDTCALFPGDLEAAAALAAAMGGGSVWFTFMEIDDDGAEISDEGVATKWDGRDLRGGYIEEGTQPWVVLDPVTRSVLNDRRERLLALERALST